jgi:hypothetical protein
VEVLAALASFVPNPEFGVFQEVEHSRSRQAHTFGSGLEPRANASHSFPRLGAGDTSTELGDINIEDVTDEVRSTYQRRRDSVVPEQCLWWALTKRRKFGAKLPTSVGTTPSQAQGTCTMVKPSASCDPGTTTE